METIHFKTVDAISQKLLRAATEQGVELNWERYERLQPQDGFLRLGLSCPFGCMDGPCRIDPFGRGPARGLCGLDRDGMVAALLLRLILQGALEACKDKAPQVVIPEKSCPSALRGMVSRALKHLGGYPLSPQEIFQSARLLQRPMNSPEHLTQQALRLGILTLLFSKPHEPVTKPSQRFICSVGYGLLSEDKVFIAVAGQVPEKLLAPLSKKASLGTRPVQLISLGDWISCGGNLLPFACTSGEAELLLSSGGIHLLLAGPRTDPSLLDLCRRLNIPFIMTQEATKAEEIVSLAKQRHATFSQTGLTTHPPLPVREGMAITTIEGFKRIAKDLLSSHLVLIGGSDTMKHTMGSLPGEVAAALREEGHHIAAWGDAALWMIKKGLGSEERNSMISILDPDQGPFLALKAMAPTQLRDIRGICFVGIKACQDLAWALGLAALGMRVCVAVPIPLWGSEKVRSLLTQKLKAVGGTMTHFDHPANPQEIIHWFQAGQANRS